MLYGLSSVALGLLLFGIVLGTTFAAIVLGRHLRAHADTLREPFGVLQAALLGLVALLLAFGLTMAVGRYERGERLWFFRQTRSGPPTSARRPSPSRFAAGPPRSRSLYRRDDRALGLHSGQRCRAGSDRAGEQLQRSLWRSAGKALAQSPTDSAPRLYVETLNEMIDAETVQTSALNNRVPTSVLTFEIIGASVALGLLALYLAIVSRGMIPVILAAAFVSLLLFITLDLDRPRRGFVRVPDTPLVSLRASMALPPAARAPTRP